MEAREAEARQRVLAQWEARLDDQQARVWEMTVDELEAHRAERNRYRAALVILRDQLKEARL